MTVQSLWRAGTGNSFDSSRHCSGALRDPVVPAHLGGRAHKGAAVRTHVRRCKN